MGHTHSAFIHTEVEIEQVVEQNVICIAYKSIANFWQSIKHNLMSIESLVNASLFPPCTTLSLL